MESTSNDSMNNDQEKGFSSELDIDDYIESQSRGSTATTTSRFSGGKDSVVRKTPRRTTSYESANDEDEERQTLLQISHENKAMKACIADLQDQVSRLAEKEEGGVPRNLIVREQARSVVDYTTSDDEDDDDGRKSAIKSVTFSDMGDTTDDEEDDGRNATTMSVRTRSTTRSRNGRQKRRTTTMLEDPDHLEQHLSEDTFGFLLATPACSSPFNMGVGVLIFQIAIYTLMTYNLTQNGTEDNIFNIPVNVPEAVWIAQIIAIIIAVVTQDDIRTGLDMLREGYSAEMRQAFPFSNRWKYALSVSARCFGGAFGLIVNFLLIVTSSTVIDLLLNFTALAFVGQLDEAAFFLSKQGFAGKICLNHATAITEATYLVPRRMVQARKTVMMIVILVIMMVGWGYVRYNQSEGVYLCATVLVQMGDDMRPELGTFSGLYDIVQPTGFTLGARHVEYWDRDAGNTRFAFCDAGAYWTLTWKESPNVTLANNPCDNWKARSSQTQTFDLTQAAMAGPWFVRDDFGREVVLEPFFLHCFDCGNTYGAGDSGQECTGRGICSNAVCQCNAGWYGLRCEFRQPCDQLTLDTRSAGTLLISNDVASHLGTEGFEILMDTRENQPVMVETYNRPVYVGHLLHGQYMIIFYSGRRWVTTHTGLMPLDYTKLATEEQGKAAILNFFDTFHGHWSLYGIEFITEPVDFGTPDDSAAPIGLLWYEALAKAHVYDMPIQSPNEARPSEVRLLCATCDDQYNPCHFNGVCVNATCQCAVGAKGSLCETSPVANGHCDHFYNVPYFEFDGGDCCGSTCISTPEYTCGEEVNGYVNQGYPFCNLPPDRWQPLHDNHIEGDPLSLAGYAVAMSQQGTLLAVGEPEQSRVRVFDEDGSIWVMRETLEGTPDSWFGVSVVISGGPAHWRNNPNFRAPLILGVGVAPKNEPHHVNVYACGNDVGCYQKDTLMNVHGKVGPEAYDISNDGRVVAYGLAHPGVVEVYEVTADYYEGERVFRQSLIPGGTANNTDSAVLAVRLSEDGNVMAVFETLPPPMKNLLRVYEWDGASYQPRGDILLETEGEVEQRQVALSDDGRVVVVGLSECPNIDIMVFVWDASAKTWISRGSPPMVLDTKCEGTYQAWSVATDHRGAMVVAGAYPNSDIVHAYEWRNETWFTVGLPIDGHHPGAETSIALAADGAHLSVGIPHAGIMESGQVATYSLPLPHCPIHEPHHFRLSLTTDYQPQNTLWVLDDVETGEVLMTGGPYPFQVATVVEETCLDTGKCHSFTIYNTKERAGLQRPGRFDLFLDGADVDRESFSGWAKRVFVGSNCLTCPEGMRMLRMMIHTCHQAAWKLEDDLGTTVFAGRTPYDKQCTNPDGIENYYWEDTCIDESKCYTFTVADTTPSDQNSPGVEFLRLYDNDVGSRTGIISSASSTFGSNCSGL